MSQRSTLPISERVVRRVAPIFITVLLGLAAVSIFTVANANVSRLYETHVNALDRATFALEQVMSRYFQVLQSVANDARLNAFARQNVDPRSATERARDVIASDPDAYLAIRYIDKTGKIALEVRNVRGFPQISIGAAVGLLENTYRNDLAYLAALGSTTSRISIGRFTLQRDERGNPFAVPRVKFPLYIPIFVDEEAAGVVQIEISAAELIDIINQANTTFIDDLNERRLLLMVRPDAYIADSGSTSLSYLNELETANGNISDTPELAHLRTYYREGDFLTLHTSNNVISATGISFTGAEPVQWRLMFQDNLFVAYANSFILLLLIIVFTLGAALMGMILTRRFVIPLITPMEVADRMALQLAQGGQLNTGTHLPLSLSANTDEDLPMVETVRRLADQIQSLSNSLNQQVNRRNRDLQVAGRIGREMATLDNLDVLLKRAINPICNELGFYHAQVFLLDDVGKIARLAYSRGEAGQQMLARAHQIEVGTNTIIGTVTAQKRPVIINDTLVQQGDVPFGFNPLLPETRAEMGLPLMIGEQVIGALDIQSKTPNVFLLDDLPTFQLLADQVAIAIYNARLKAQTDRRIQQIDRLNRQLTRQAWDSARDEAALQTQYGTDLTSSTQLSVPIAIRGEVIGELAAALPEGDFSDGDRMVLNAVAERVALAIENARLFQETQSALTETSALYQLSRTLNEASTLEDVIQAIISLMAPSSIGGQIWLFDDYSPSGSPEWARLTVDLPLRQMRVISDLDRSFLRFENHPLLRQMNPNEVVSIDHLAEHPLIDARLRSLFEPYSAQAVLFIPLNMRGIWKGFIALLFDEMLNLNPREMRVFNALIGQAGAAVDNRLLLKQTEDALSRNEKLYAASRIINTSQRLADLVYAAVATTGDNRVNFWLALLEQDSRSSDVWNVRIRLIAQSNSGVVDEVDTLLEFHVSPESPLRMREAEVILDPGADIEDVPPLVAWIRSLEQRFLAIFPLFSDVHPIALFFISATEHYELSAEDYEVYKALTGQMSTQIQNYRLLERAEFERANLNQILSTLPAGVLVLDPINYQPIQNNERLQELLGRPIDYSRPFTSEAYALYRNGSPSFYPDTQLPIYAANLTNQPMFADDLVVMNADMQIDLLVNAAPIYDAEGKKMGIVATFQDISNLRSLENTLQENLRETVTLYETQRSISEAESLEELLDHIALRLHMLDVEQAFIILSSNAGDEVPYMARVTQQTLEDVDALYPILRDSMTVIDDVKTDITLPKVTRDVLVAVGAGAVQVVPLLPKSRNVPLGWFLLVDSRLGHFSSEEERILSSVGDMATTALDNNFLVQSTQQALQETAALYTAASTISRARDLDELRLAIQAALEALQPDFYATYLLQEDEIYELFAVNFEPAFKADLSTLVTSALPQEDSAYIPDIARSTLGEFERELLNMGTMMAAAAVNLRIKESFGGRMILGFSTPRRFRDGDIRYLNTVADSASVVLDNILLLEQVQNTLQETSVLYQASRALTQASSPDDIVDVIVNYLIETHVNQVLVSLLNTDSWSAAGAVAQVVAAWDKDDILNMQGVSFLPEQFPAWHLLATDVVLEINDVEDPNSPLDEITREALASLNIRSCVIIPLRVTGRAIGAIWLNSPDPHQYTERDLRIFQAFAEQTSLSLEAARLLEQTERRATQLETTAQISERVGSILDLDVLLPQVVDLIRERFRYDHVQVFLMDDVNEWAVLRASTGEAGKQLLAVNHRLRRGSDSVIGRVTETGEQTLALDTADANVIHQPNPYLPMTRSELAIPLKIKGRVVGALDVQSNQANAFSEEDIQALTTLAAQIAVAIDNARLYEEAFARAQDMSFLFDITNAAASAESLDKALKETVTRVRASLNVLNTAIYLPQIYRDFSDNQRILLRPSALAGEGQPLNELSEVLVGDSENLVGMVASTLQAQVVRNIDKEVRYTPIAPQAKSAVIAAIVSGQEMVGLLVMESAQVGAFSHDQMTLMLTLAGSLAAIIQNGLLVNQLQSTNERLREVDRLKSQFLANMSHELRTPLNSIIGFSRVMLKGVDGPLTEMQEQDLTTIFNSGNHLLSLINDILDQAKIEANEMNLRFAYFDMKPMIEAVRSIAIGLVKDKPLELYIEIAPNMPQAYGDEFRTRQVLLNLVSNAIKFTTQGNVTLRAYQLEGTGNNKPVIRVDVVDTGIGIEEKDLPILFAPFRQVDSSLTRTVGGTGLGLPISKSLVEMQGGQLSVASQIGVGSTFSVTIPTAPGAEQELERRRAAGKPLVPTSSSTSNGNDSVILNKPLMHETQSAPAIVLPPTMPIKRDVLLIEDNKDMVDQFRRALQREGFEVQTADHPSYAEAMVGQLRPTVVVMDVNFADGQGWTILRNLKERDDTFDIPIIVNTLGSDSERAYQLGAYQFIQRPFTPDVLVNAVLQAEKDNSGERIVIIDDRPDDARLLTHLLTEHGNYKVYAASNGREGISMIARRRPSLIILDLRMPEMDGFAVLGELRGNPETAKIPVIVVTGEIDLNSDEQARLANVRVVPKSDISEDEYERFISDVRAHLNTRAGS